MNRATAAGVLAAVRPTFMIPAVGMSLYGGALAPGFDGFRALVHAAAVALALLVAHLRDSYVDGHVRGEERPLLDAPSLRLGVRAGVAGFVAVWAVLWVTAGPATALITAPLLAFALLHAPYLDRNPVAVTTDYPVGIGLVLLGGYAAQTGTVGSVAGAVALLFALHLSGIKVAIDRLDESFDRTIEKRTLPVLLGPGRADAVAVLLFATVLVALLAATVVGLVPATAVAVGLVPVGCGVAVATLGPRTTVRVQMALTYLFAAGLFLAVCRTDCGGWRLAERFLFSDIEPVVAAVQR